MAAADTPGRRHDCRKTQQVYMEEFAQGHAMAGVQQSVPRRWVDSDV